MIPSSAVNLSLRIPALALQTDVAAPPPPLGEVLPLWSVLPFIVMLLAVAVLPLIAPHFWHLNRNRVLVSLCLGLPVAVWMAALDAHAVLHVAHEYAAFIILLCALFVISGGIVIRGTLAGTPGINTLLLLIGAVLASFIGTTGASMLLIRPLLRANSLRKRKIHVFVFFIFLVSNIGGLLTPLGDPPLFLGFLRGVPFTWTFTLLPQWVFLCTIVLVLFYVVDATVFRQEAAASPHRPAGDAAGPATPISIVGVHNFVFLTGVVATIYCSGQFKLPAGAQEVGMLVMAALSLLTTPHVLHEENAFSWEPIIEVAAIFAGIFATMIPALAILNVRGADMGLSEPWQFFWATGVLSSFLDNAPTYLTFTATASGLLGTDAALLQQLLEAEGGEALLRAISLGAVFMGANTYIGNGPNFMVKAIAEQGGVKMPSFFGYMVYSVGILFPLFLLVTVVFLR